MISDIKEEAWQLIPENYKESWDYYEQLYIHRLDNLKEMDKFLGYPICGCRIVHSCLLWPFVFAGSVHACSQPHSLTDSTFFFFFPTAMVFQVYFSSKTSVKWNISPNPKDKTTKSSGVRKSCFHSSLLPLAALHPLPLHHGAPKSLSSVNLL